MSLGCFALSCVVSSILIAVAAVMLQNQESCDDILMIINYYYSTEVKTKTRKQKQIESLKFTGKALQVFYFNVILSIY